MIIVFFSRIYVCDYPPSHEIVIIADPTPRDALPAPPPLPSTISLAHSSTFFSDQCALVRQEVEDDPYGIQCWRQRCCNKILAGKNSSKKIPSVLPDTIPDVSEVRGWKSADVKEFADSLYFLQGYDSERFVEEDVDGEALLMCNSDDLTRIMRMKLGPTLKFLSVLRAIKHRVG